jgi:protein SCO1/2
MLRRPWAWGAFALALLAIPVAAKVGARRAAPLPVYGQVPAFALVDQTGAPFTTHDLDGAVWVTDFIFTGCSQACPRLTGELGRLQTFLANRGALGRVKLLSISLDPTRDRREQLAAYATGFHADARVWKFVTGPAQQIEDTVVGGFKVSVERRRDDEAPSGFSIVHGTHLVLIDARGRIRGYYDAADAAAMTQLRADLARLVEARGGA